LGLESEIKSQERYEVYYQQFFIGSRSCHGCGYGFHGKRSCGKRNAGKEEVVYCGSIWLLPVFDAPFGLDYGTLFVTVFS